VKSLANSGIKKELVQLAVESEPQGSYLVLVLLRAGVVQWPLL
jgi:hypothetical protein